MKDAAAADQDRTGIQVIARAVSILRALEAEPDGLSLGELAARVGLARSTVQRIVGALTDEQMLMSAGPRQGVTLGPALFRLAAAANVGTDRIIRPVLQDLSRQLEETVDLSTLQGDAAMFVDQVVGTSRLVAISAVGASFPLHCTANGKALLTCVQRERIGRLMRGALRRYTPNTITDLAALQAELDEARRTHLAFDREEHSEGICAVGVAFIDPFGRDFAVSVPVPTARFATKSETIARHLLRARDEILRVLPGARAA